jgi:hypothetical protein
VLVTSDVLDRTISRAAPRRTWLARIRSVTEEHRSSNGSKLLTVDTLIKIILLLVALVAAYQRVVDKMEYTEREVAQIQLWQDTERQLAQSFDRRLTVIETKGWRPVGAPKGE